SKRRAPSSSRPNRPYVAPSFSSTAMVRRSGSGGAFGAGAAQTASATRSGSSSARREGMAKSRRTGPRIIVTNPRSVQIPQHQVAALATGGRGHAVGADGHAQQRARLPVERPGALAVGGVQAVRQPLARDGQQRRPVGVERDVGDVAG